MRCEGGGLVLGGWGGLYMWEGGWVKEVGVFSFSFVCVRVCV